MKTPKKEKETYPRPPQDHEQEAQKAVEQLRREGHSVQKDGDCAGGCPLCEPYGVDPDKEFEILSSLLQNKLKAAPEATRAALAKEPAYYTVNRTRLQALAALPSSRVTRAKTEPHVIVEVSITIGFDDYSSVTAVIRGLRVLLVDDLKE